MSYLRFLEGDAYVYMSVGGWLECSWCNLQAEDFGNFVAHKTQDMIDHLREHQKQGSYIPERVFENLLHDDAENFPKRSINGTDND
jgi:hypothetical protein